MPIYFSQAIVSNYKLLIYNKTTYTIDYKPLSSIELTIINGTEFILTFEALTIFIRSIIVTE